MNDCPICSGMLLTCPSCDNAQHCGRCEQCVYCGAVPNDPPETPRLTRIDTFTKLYIVPRGQELLPDMSHVYVRDAMPGRVMLQIRTNSKSGATHYLAEACLTPDEARQTVAALQQWIERAETVAEALTS